MGVSVKVFDSSGNLVTDVIDMTRRQKLGEKFTFVADPFPISNDPRIGVVTSEPIRGSSPSLLAIRKRPRPRLPDTRIRPRQPKRISTPPGKKSTRVTGFSPLKQRKRIFAISEPKILRDGIKMKKRELSLRRKGGKENIRDANALKRRRLNLEKFIQKEKREIRLLEKKSSRKITPTITRSKIQGRTPNDVFANFIGSLNTPTRRRGRGRGRDRDSSFRSFF